MNLSTKGAAFVRLHEGFVASYYLDPVAVGTIGVGFTWSSQAFRDWWAKNKPGKTFGPGSTMTRAEADDALLFLFTEEYGKAVNDFLKKEVPQHVFDGTASPVYNLGPGSLKWKWAAAVKSGDFAAAARLLEKTGTTAKGKKLAGLVRRRKEEAMVIEMGIYTGVDRVVEVAKPDAMADGILMRGEQGPAVAALIRDLHALGFYKGAMDDLFGYGTEAAVLDFQRKHGLKADGYAGPKTLAAIRDALGDGSNTKPPLNLAPADMPISTDTIRSVQQLLRDRGYPEVGNVDGFMGNRTRNAILAFQADNDLKLTGEITDALLADLIKAPQREVAASRATATEKDLKTSPSVQMGDTLKKVGGAVIAISGVGGVLEGSGDVSDMITGINKVKALWEAVASVSPWLLGAAAGGAAIYFGSRFIREQVQAYREGRHV